MYIVSSRNVKTTWEKNVEQLFIFIETDLSVGCEQSWWVKGICDLGADISLPPCLIGSRHMVRGRLVSDTSVSDPRAEISGIRVMVRRSSVTSRGTTNWFKDFLFSLAPVFRLRMKKKCNKRNEGSNKLYPRV